MATLYTLKYLPMPVCPVFASSTSLCLNVTCGKITYGNTKRRVGLLFKAAGKQLSQHLLRDVLAKFRFVGKFLNYFNC
jgi:hypothetical protein